jgi:uncharacterized protein YbjT (DUF2867 family)
MTPTRVAVAGGTGVAGAAVVRALATRGIECVVLARSTGVDVISGAGLNAALRGCDVLVDAVSVQALRASTAVVFFETAAANLVAAAGRAGVSHVVLLSIVGIDDVPMGYYVGKRAQERVVRAGPVPWTILRATQFQEFPAQLLAQQRGPVAFVPPMRCAPVAVREVGEYLADLVHAGPQGMAEPLRGPEELPLIDMARRVVSATGGRRWVAPLPALGRLGQALRQGVLVPADPCRRGRTTFAEYLETVKH